MKSFNFIDLFAGIGGFRIALEKLGGECVGFSEIDKNSIQIYKQNFNTTHDTYLGDITKIKKLPPCDLIVGGVPCQPWSVAGKMKGFDDNRGKLWNNVFKLVEQAQPKSFIFENVKGLIDPRNKECFELIIQSFEKLNYRVSYQLLNAYDFGLPQNRDRVFIVGIKKGLKTTQSFEFPKPMPINQKLFNFLELNNPTTNDTQTVKFTPQELFGQRIPASRNRFQKDDELNDFFILCDTRNGHTTIHSWDIIPTSKREKSICETLLKNRRKSIYGNQDGNPLSYLHLKELIPNLKSEELSKLVTKKILKKTNDNKFGFVNSKNSSGINGIYRIYLPESRIFSTLTATGTKDHVATLSVKKDKPELYKKNFIQSILKEKKFRVISTREAARLQGFPENFIPHPNYKVSMKQFGNAVPIHVVEAVAKCIIKTSIFKSSHSTKNEQTRTPPLLENHPDL